MAVSGTGMIATDPDWFRDREYWSANRRFIWSDRLIGSSVEAAARIASLLALEPGASVLDLACGFGRHSLELSAAGYRVTGIDLNPDLIGEAVSSATSRGLDARFICADMRDYVEPDAFASVICMFNSFGYFADPKDDRLVLENCLRSLVPGGSLLLAVPPREVVRRSCPSRSSRYWREDSDGTILLEEATVDEAWTWHAIRWTVLRGAKRREYCYGMRLYGASELRDLLASVGFTDTRLLDSLAGRPYGDESQVLVIVARKPLAPA
ncbi:MAG: class I SAM-dependent methyltransferase [Candidatus Fermentibacter sp.]|nr:class I SAM-dependent methyltransferase [Candidatus Fermentibacter sp.]